MERTQKPTVTSTGPPVNRSISQLINHSINDFGIRHSFGVPKNDTICSIIENLRIRTFLEQRSHIICILPS